MIYVPTASVAAATAFNVCTSVPCMQPLFIQTPLQVMLETLVEKLQMQAGVIAGMQDSVGGCTGAG